MDEIRELKNESSKWCEIYAASKVVEGDAMRLIGKKFEPQ
jgi:hypothetical protein